MYSYIIDTCIMYIVTYLHILLMHTYTYMYTHTHIYMHEHINTWSICLYVLYLQELTGRPVSESVMKFTLVRSTRKDFFTSFAIFSELICSICLSKQKVLESREAKPCV